MYRVRLWINLPRQCSVYRSGFRDRSDILLHGVVDPKWYTRLFVVKLFALLEGLAYYQEMIKKHIDLIQRRLLKGETIPSAEKVFSIFEPHTEWISKGKANKKVELGHKILIATDQHHFILHHQVIQSEADAALTVPLADSLLCKYSNIESLSLDKGFYSKENKELLSLSIPQVVMPKKGKLNAVEKEDLREDRHDLCFRQPCNP